MTREDLNNYAHDGDCDKCEFVIDGNCRLECCWAECGAVKRPKAKCPCDVKDNTCWFGDEDRYDDIVSVEEVKD